ncbi:hypothetical protein GCM10010123_02300 [Pilimelia anulata]|uniref:HTH cro/C1-type domain-containing protein n=1 Tax=Pilimelia anulata TaxID=53371 RepID=A0A8J3F833_9ACTN|nr:helix-turn-helix transcriptional regulator [Pilimelia anulata]GGJ75910.1 hypothetical protein GCM10010123_02300 [Pilimelia anulata]
MTSEGIGQNGHPARIRASAVVAAQVKSLRKRRGMSATVFTSRCAELGAPAMTLNVLANIETGRRGVSVDELLVFALVLDVAPAHLLAPPDDARHLAITDDVTVPDARTAEQWMVGRQPLPQSHAGRYLGYALERSGGDSSSEAAPESKAAVHAAAMRRARRRTAEIDADTDRLAATMRTQASAFFDNLQQMAVIGGATPEHARKIIEVVKEELGEADA